MKSFVSYRRSNQFVFSFHILFFAVFVVCVLTTSAGEQKLNEQPSQENSIKTMQDIFEKIKDKELSDEYFDNLIETFKQSVIIAIHKKEDLINVATLIQQVFETIKRRFEGQHDKENAHIENFKLVLFCVNDAFNRRVLEKDELSKEEIDKISQKLMNSGSTVIKIYSDSISDIQQNVNDGMKSVVHVVKTHYSAAYIAALIDAVVNAQLYSNSTINDGLELEQLFIFFSQVIDAFNERVVEQPTFASEIAPKVRDALAETHYTVSLEVGERLPEFFQSVEQSTTFIDSLRNFRLLIFQVYKEINTPQCTQKFCKTFAQIFISIIKKNFKYFQNEQFTMAINMTVRLIIRLSSDQLLFSTLITKLGQTIPSELNLHQVETLFSAFREMAQNADTQQGRDAIQNASFVLLWRIFYSSNVPFSWNTINSIIRIYKNRFRMLFIGIFVVLISIWLR